MLPLILGGAALQRCGNHIAFNAASAAEGRPQIAGTQQVQIHASSLQFSTKPLYCPA
jgi:hypothetical protein